MSKAWSPPPDKGGVIGGRKDVNILASEPEFLPFGLQKGFGEDVGRHMSSVEVTRVNLRSSTIFVQTGNR